MAQTVEKQQDCFFFKINFRSNALFKIINNQIIISQLKSLFVDENSASLIHCIKKMSFAMKSFFFAFQLQRKAYSCFATSSSLLCFIFVVRIFEICFKVYGLSKKKKPFQWWILIYGGQYIVYNYADALRKNVAKR